MNKSMTNVLNKEGIRYLWKGNGANVLRIFPQMGINYTICKYSRENIFKDSKLDNMNAIEQLSEDVLDVLTLCGLKFYGKGKRNDT